MRVCIIFVDPPGSPPVRAPSQVWQAIRVRPRTPVLLCLTPTSHLSYLLLAPPAKYLLGRTTSHTSFATILDRAPLFGLEYSKMLSLIQDIAPDCHVGYIPSADKPPLISHRGNASTVVHKALHDLEHPSLPPTSTCPLLSLSLTFPCQTRLQVCYCLRSFALAILCRVILEYLVCPQYCASTAWYVCAHSQGPSDLVLCVCVSDMWVESGCL